MSSNQFRFRFLHTDASSCHLLGNAVLLYSSVKPMSSRCFQGMGMQQALSTYRWTS